MPSARKSAPRKAPARKPAGGREKVETQTPNSPTYRGRVDKAKYDAMKKILLKVIPRKAPGITQAEMFDALEKLAPKDTFPGTTYGWWGKSVQLDLEARGVVARDPKARPLRWRRV